MRSVLSAAVLAAALTHAAAAQVSPPPAPADRLQRCHVPGLDEVALCAHLLVPETRGSPGSRTIPLNIVVLPATDSALPDPLVFLAGGGVVPASRYAGFLSNAFPTLRRYHDILLVDQRGTWNSNPLACPDAGGPGGGPAELMACRDALAARANLEAYTTVEAMRDLDSVRAWLGYQRLDLFGTSYGTKAAQVYMRAYRDHVRAAVLYGVVPVFAPSQLDLAASSQSSLERVFTACAADPRCHLAFPGLRMEFDSVLARLLRAPAQGDQGPISDRLVRNVIQSMLSTSRGIEQIPLLIHSAFDGNFGPLASALNPPTPPPPGPPRGVFLSIFCSEAIPQIDPARIDGATRGSFFGDAPVRSQMRQCADWPHASLPGSFWDTVRTDVPVLAVTGDLDPITPPRYGQAVAAALGGTHLVLPNRSHGDADDCITGMFETFLIEARMSAVDTRCVSQPHVLNFAIPGGAAGR